VNHNADSLPYHSVLVAPSDLHAYMPLKISELQPKICAELTQAMLSTASEICSKSIYLCSLRVRRFSRISHLAKLMAWFSFIVYHTDRSAQIPMAAVHTHEYRRMWSLLFWLCKDER
jgi:hypothetical protein